MKKENLLALSSNRKILNCDLFDLSFRAYMTVQTFIPNSAQAASENTVTQPQHTLADGSVKKLYIETQGCQMNEYDSHRMADLLGDSHGYVLTTDPKQADILLMNTCSIREKAQEKVFSELGRWRKLKEKILIW